MTKGWYGQRFGHSLASRGISSADLSKYSGYKFYPYENANDLYNWLIKNRKWDSYDAIQYVQSIINGDDETARKIVDENYAYVSTIDAFIGLPMDKLSTIYYSINDDDGNYADSWSYKYAFNGSVWRDPESIIKEDDKERVERLLRWQKEALEELGIAGIDTKPTHVQMGVVPFDEPEEIYGKMQGESWSPLGEARRLVRRNKTHTSMSIGDIVKTPDGKYQIVAGFGFLDLEYLRKWHGLEG